MTRANRHYIPGCIWHITHRCHKKEFLLKFARDRSRFVMWLGEARSRFGLQVLNYSITSNHVHLLVKDHGSKSCIPAAIQLIAGRTGQEFNQRKSRKGASENRDRARNCGGDPSCKRDRNPCRRG